jgi:hypothetical protein
MNGKARDSEEAGAGAPGGVPAGGAAADSQAHTLNEILLGVIAIGDICSRMQESLLKAARPVAEAVDAEQESLLKAARPVAEAVDAEQELVSAATALCSFRAASVAPASAAGAVPVVSAALAALTVPASSEAPAASVASAALSARGARPRWRLRSDVGRRVSVMWVRPGFPPDTEPSARDLMAFYGVVEKHLRTRKSGTHLVLYDDGQRRWHKKDGLFAFL